VLCAVAFVTGVLLRENRLSTQVAERERRILVEFPTVAELLALAVGAGEGPVAALDRVVSRSRGELSGELAVVLADIRTGSPVTAALDALARRSGLPVVSRFAEGMAVAIERGTPLSGVLHAQATDVREAGRRALIESGARKEIAMMVTIATGYLSKLSGVASAPRLKDKARRLPKRPLSCCSVTPDLVLHRKQISDVHAVTISLSTGSCVGMPLLGLGTRRRP